MSEPVEQQSPQWEMRGHPTDDEVAAVVAVLAARAGTPSLQVNDDRPLAGGWTSYYRTVRPRLVYGREAWRSWLTF